MVVSEEEDPRLEQILAKTVAEITVKDINKYTLEENIYPLLNLNTFVRNNSFVIVSSLLVLIAVSAFRRRRSKQADGSGKGDA